MSPFPALLTRLCGRDLDESGFMFSYLSHLVFVVVVPSAHFCYAKVARATCDLTLYVVTCLRGPMHHIPDQKGGSLAFDDM